MTALCGGGSSGPKPGVDASIALSGSAIDAAVSAAGFPELAPVIAVIASGTVLATDIYCTQDPPDDPGLTLQDITDASNPGNPIVFLPAAGKVKDAFLHWYWYQVCQCISDPTPPTPPLSFPDGYGTNPGLPGGQTGQANCWMASQQRGPNYANGRSWNFSDTLPGALGVHNDGEFRSRLIPIPLPTSLQLTITNHGGGDNPAQVEPLVNWYNAAGSAISGTYAGPGISPGDPTFVHNIPIPTAAVEFQVICIALTGEGAVDNDVELTSTLFCGGSGPTTVSSSCCPPDPMVDTYLRNIYAIVNNIFLALPQIAPPVTSWDENGTHAGLTGVGAFGIGGGSVAVKFHFTSIPRQVGQSIEDPDFYFDLGFVSFTTLEGTYSSMRIERADSVFTVPPLGFTVNYDIRYGAVATAIELIPHVEVLPP